VKTSSTLFLVASAIVMSACTTISGPVQNKISQPVVTGNAWYDNAQKALAARKRVEPINTHARNVILFVGDGMDPTTVTAARIFDGQSRGEAGEENILSFEAFPYVAYSKTYTTDYQVPDSAGTMSAMVTGVKTKSGVLSISDAAPHGDCAAALAAKVDTIGELAEKAGLALGIVSTAEITHATPGAVYAHTPNRGWANDSAMPDTAKAAGCTDIARQLIEFPYGDGIDVALGGGRRHFTPSTQADPENSERMGNRADERDLTAEWASKSSRHRYVWNKAGFDAAPTTSKLLGLFEPSHVKFAVDRDGDVGGEPSLPEMTAKAIKILSRNKNGFFLMVESGKIDHAHHAGNAYRALTETQEYAEAVKIARKMTSENDTLIIVTADHGHTLAIQGYPPKGNDILGLSGSLARADGKPYTTLSYANGPGTVFSKDLPSGRPAPDADEVTGKDYLQQALIPTGSETHGGQDVPVYASGPKAHLIGGVFEQNYIFHVMADALGLVGE
jgi:alkaline phosphatase